eukprot:scaffold455717_cov18-Prasinocladus_malaysianus.AAC.1
MKLSQLRRWRPGTGLLATCGLRPSARALVRYGASTRDAVASIRLRLRITRCDRNLHSLVLKCSMTRSGRRHT